MEFAKLLSRHLSGEMTPEEEVAFRREMERGPGKQVLLEEYRKIWEAAGSQASQADYDLDAEWALMQEMLPAYHMKPGARKLGRGGGRSLLYYSYRIAAVLVLGLLLSFSWIYVTRIAGTEKVMAVNEPVEVILGDGTRVLVNRHSSLRYKRRFDEQERKVFLSGEAWFNVSRDTTRPFVIDAGLTLVEVLGTSFNVNAYKENPAVEITVESGMVAMSAKEDQGNLIVMKAGSGGSYNKDQKELKLLPSPHPNKLSWKTRELFFEGSTLLEVTELVNRVYGASLVIMNSELAACPITVTFRNQSLDAIVNVLEMTLDLQVTRVGDEIQLDGEGCVE